MKKGDLVYVPASTYLSNTGDMLATSFFKKTEKPNVFLILDQDDKNYKIILQGEKWYVSKRDAYKIEENNDS